MSQLTQPLVQRLVRAEQPSGALPAGHDQHVDGADLGPGVVGEDPQSFGGSNRLPARRNRDHLNVSFSHFAGPERKDFPRTGEIKFLRPVEEGYRDTHPRTVTRITSGMLGSAETTVILLLVSNLGTVLWKCSKRRGSRSRAIPRARAGGNPNWKVRERMNIVVLVKQVPDTEAERKLNPDDNTVDRAAVDPVINYIDEFAIEEGLRLKEAHGGEVTILTVGPERATESIRKALSMGADKAVHVSDEALHGSDAIQTAKIIAKALGTIEWDLAVAGSEATDSRMAIVPALVAEALGVAQLTLARKVTVDGSTVTIERVTDTGYESVQGSTPAVISVVEKINDPRYPSFKGIMAAKSKPVTVLALSDLGLDASEVGLANAWTQVASFENAPPRAAGQTVKDEGNGGVQIADYLASKKLI